MSFHFLRVKLLIQADIGDKFNCRPTLLNSKTPIKSFTADCAAYCSTLPPMPTACPQNNKTSVQEFSICATLTNLAGYQDISANASPMLAQWFSRWLGITPALGSLVFGVSWPPADPCLDRCVRGDPEERNLDQPAMAAVTQRRLAGGPTAATLAHRRAGVGHNPRRRRTRPGSLCRQ